MNAKNKPTTPVLTKESALYDCIKAMPPYEHKYLCASDHGRESACDCGATNGNVLRSIARKLIGLEG